MKTKPTGPERSDSNNTAIRRESISDAAMIFARQVTHLGLEALRSDTMTPAHALRGLMAAMITVSSAEMDRVDVVSWFRALADELEAEEREEYCARVRASLRESQPARRGSPDLAKE